MAERHSSRFIFPAAALVSAAIAVALWSLVLNGGDRNSLRTNDQTAAATQGGDPELGEQLIVRKGCGGCHDIPGIPGPHGTVGPSLNDLSNRQFIAGRLANSPDNLTLWIENPRGVDPDTAMPNLGLSHAQARDIAAYLYNPKS